LEVFDVIELGLWFRG